MKTTCMVALMVLAAGLTAGCGADEAETPSVDEPATEATDNTADNAEPTDTEEPPAEACSVDGEAGDVAEDPTFELRATLHGPYTAGQDGAFSIELTPRGGYHVNEDYPTSIRPCAPSAVTLPSAELGNSDAQERSAERARFDVHFTAAEAGEHRVSAVVDFAVCSDENCMPETRTLAVLLPVQ